MKDYTLAANEVLLFKGSVTEADFPDRETELVLTNLHIAFIRTEEVDSPEEHIIIHPVSDIKIYKDVPQIKRTHLRAEIFWISGETTITFKTASEANRFMDAALELLTGKTKLARSAGKIKKAIGDVNEALGVNIIEEAKNFSVDAVTRIVKNTMPSGLKLLSGKKKNKKAKEK